VLKNPSVVGFLVVVVDLSDNFVEHLPGFFHVNATTRRGGGFGASPALALFRRFRRFQSSGLITCRCCSENEGRQTDTKNEGMCSCSEHHGSMPVGSLKKLWYDIDT